MWSSVGYRRHRGVMNVIICGLPAIQVRYESDQLWAPGDTGEELMWSSMDYRRYRWWINVMICRLLAIQERTECDQLRYRRYRVGINVIVCGLPATQRRNEYDQLLVTGDTGKELMWSAVGYRRYRGGIHVISCGLLAIDSHLLRIEYERYQQSVYPSIFH